MIDITKKDLMDFVGGVISIVYKKKEAGVETAEWWGEIETISLAEKPIQQTLNVKTREDLLEKLPEEDWKSRGTPYYPVSSLGCEFEVLFSGNDKTLVVSSPHRVVKIYTKNHPEAPQKQVAA